MVACAHKYSRELTTNHTNDNPTNRYKEDEGIRGTRTTLLDAIIPKYLKKNL